MKTLLSLFITLSLMPFIEAQFNSSVDEKKVDDILSMNPTLESLSENEKIIATLNNLASYSLPPCDEEIIAKANKFKTLKESSDAQYDNFVRETFNNGSNPNDYINAFITTKKTKAFNNIYTTYQYCMLRGAYLGIKSKKGNKLTIKSEITDHPEIAKEMESIAKEMNLSGDFIIKLASEDQTCIGGLHNNISQPTSTLYIREQLLSSKDFNNSERERKVFLRAFLRHELMHEKYSHMFWNKGLINFVATVPNLSPTQVHFLSNGIGKKMLSYETELNKKYTKLCRTHETQADVAAIIEGKNPLQNAQESVLAFSFLKKNIKTGGHYHPSLEKRLQLSEKILKIEEAKKRFYKNREYNNRFMYNNRNKTLTSLLIGAQYTINHPLYQIKAPFFDYRKFLLYSATAPANSANPSIAPGSQLQWQQQPCAHSYSFMDIFKTSKRFECGGKNSVL